MDNKLTNVNWANGQPELDVYKVAAASSDGIVINQHFGRADTFYIYEVAGTDNYRFLETRTITPVCSGGNHNEEKLCSNIRMFQDCKYIIASRIGMGAANRIEQSGIIPVELPGIIEESLGKLITYEQLQHLF